MEQTDICRHLIDSIGPTDTMYPPKELTESKAGKEEMLLMFL